MVGSCAVCIGGALAFSPALCRTPSRALMIGGRCAVPPIVPTIRAPAQPASGFVTGRAPPAKKSGCHKTAANGYSKRHPATLAGCLSQKL